MDDAEEVPAPEQPPPRPRPAVSVDPRWGRYAGLFALLLVVVFTITTIRSHPLSAKGIAPGATVPPFAVPLAAGNVRGAADVATRPNQGGEGKVPACQERGPGILNVCELYEREPVVLALFINTGGCEAVLGDMQAIAPSFPNVRFAAVAIKEGRQGLLSLIRKRRLTFPVGFDEEGILARRYNVGSCPQVNFVLPGGVVQSAALLSRPSRGTLRTRVAELLAAARAHGGAS